MLGKSHLEFKSYQTLGKLQCGIAYIQHSHLSGHENPSWEDCVTAVSVRKPTFVAPLKLPARVKNAGKLLLKALASPSI